MDSRLGRKALSWMDGVAKKVEKRLAREAGNPRLGNTVGTGASGTDTYLLDQMAEETIFAELSRAPIPLNVVSEESAPIEKGAAHTLVVDPVDGSSNMKRGIPFYSVSLAIGGRTQSTVEVGLVRNLVTGQTYSALKGAGAHLDGAAIKVRKLDPGDVFISANVEKEEPFRNKEGGRLHIRCMGSAALETCLVAQGAIDGFVAFRPYLRIIDISAAALILSEAGGQVYGPDRKPFDAPFNAMNRFGFVGLGDPRAWSVLA